MKALYICDNKDEWNTFHNLFKTHFPKVELVCAIKGTDGLDYLSYEGPFGIIMIEASTKADDPSALGEKIIEVSGQRPLIWVGSQTLIKDRVDDKLYMNHEINGIIERPINVQNFRNTIQSSLEWAKKEEFEQSIEELAKENLLPMKIRNFYLFDKIPYDVYLELTSTKFTKIISSNKTYTHSTILSYANKNIKWLYLRKDEYLKFLEDSIKALTIKFEKRIKNTRIAIILQTKAALVIQQYIRTVGVTEEISKLIEKVIECTEYTYEYEPNFLKLIEKFPFENRDFAEQSILASYFCEAIANGMGWQSGLGKRKLGLASLLHDCMLTNEDLIKINSLNDSNLKMFSEEDQLEFKEHPAKAARLAAHFQGFPETDFIIAEHQELPDGSGFPQGINANKLTAISSIFILSVNVVARLVNTGLSPQQFKDAVTYLKEDFNVGNFKDALKVLEKKTR